MIIALSSAISAVRWSVPLILDHIRNQIRERSERKRQQNIGTWERDISHQTQRTNEEEGDRYGTEE